MESEDARNPLPCVISWKKKKKAPNESKWDVKKIHVNTKENLWPKK